MNNIEQQVQQQQKKKLQRPLHFVTCGQKVLWQSCRGFELCSALEEVFRKLFENGVLSQLKVNPGGA